MNEFSSGYEVLRTYVRLAFWLTHHRVVVVGRHLIPKGKPIIFAANHQNALMDPLAVTCTNSLQTLWLARADIFRSKAAQSFLNFLKMLPVYRIRDGKDNLSNNEHIFGQVVKVLENRQSVALFPEAAHSGKRQMLPHRKAIPRIALDAEAKSNFNLGLQIVPTGIYYSHYWFFDRTLIVQYGKPIDVDRYKDNYAESPQKAMLTLRDEIHDKIIPLTLQINSTQYYQEYEELRRIVGESYLKTNTFSKEKILNRFYAEQELIARLEQIESGQPEQFSDVLEKTRSYFQNLTGMNLSDEQVSRTEKSSLTGLLLQLGTIIAAFPVIAFGFIFNAIPFFIPRFIFRRKVKDMAFLSTFNFVTGLVLFPIFYILSGVLIYAISGSPTFALLITALMPFGGKIAFKLLRYYQEIFRSVVLMCFNNSALRQLAKQRNEITGLVLKLIG